MDEKTVEIDRNVSMEVAAVQVNSLGVRARGQRRRCVTIPQGDKIVKQADKDRACIHQILKRAAHGVPVPTMRAQPMSGELPSVETFHEAMGHVAKASQAFDALPVKVREKFSHNPAEFLKFVSNPENIEDMVELGLATIRKDAPIPKVEIVNPAPVTEGATQ